MIVRLAAEAAADLQANSTPSMYSLGTSGQTSPDAPGFIMLLKTAHNLKWVNCLFL